MNSNLVQTILDHVAVDTVQVNSQLQIVGWSKGAQRYAASAFQPGLAASECFPELGGIETELEAVRTGQLPEIRFDKINRDTAQGHLYYSLTVVAFRLEDTQSDGLVCLLSDVTETSRLEQSLTQQRNELSVLYHRLEEQHNRLVELGQVKSAFVAIASHELRSPLSSVHGFLDLVLDGSAGPLNDQQKHFLSVANRGVNRILTLTNDLLDIERIESGKMSLNLVAVQLPMLAHTIVNNFQMELARRDMTIVFQNDNPTLTALADTSRVEQILTNFISNAIKYSPEGSQIVISFEEKDGQVVTHIQDRGIGISAEDQQHLFQRFYRASNANSRGARGNGLGLSIVQAIIERHGGRVWVESILGEGSTFSFSLPKHPA